MTVVCIVLVCGLAMILREVHQPGRDLPPVDGWIARAVFLTVVQALVAALANLTWDRWLPGFALGHLGGHGVVIDALLGYFVLTFVYYWWHRARHEIPFLWRWFHQVHHSPARIEVLTSFYKHPVEVLANGLLSSWIVFVLLGLGPASAALVATFTGLAELFYHWNVKTPYWVGFFFQRPESHCVHHERGRHTNNYSDLPLWDMLFGTFENPRIAPTHFGLGVDVERRLPALLAGEVAARSAR